MTTRTCLILLASMALLTGPLGCPGDDDDAADDEEIVVEGDGATLTVPVGAVMGESLAVRL